jgi:hypothetical protein
LENEITEGELQSLTENLYNGFNSRHKENLCDYNAFDFYSRVYLQLLKLRLKPNKKQETVKREPLKKENQKEDKPKLQFGNFIIRKFIK